VGTFDVNLDATIWWVDGWMRSSVTEFLKRRRLSLYVKDDASIAAAKLIYYGINML